MVLIPLIALLAAIVKSATGFGLALVVVGLGAVAIGPEHAIPLAALLDAATGLALLHQTRSRPRPAVWRPMAVAMGTGALVGALLFARVDAERLVAPIGVIVLVSAVLLALARRRTTPAVRSGLAPGVAVGVSGLGGVLGGLLGPGGPPVVLAATLAYDKDDFRALLAPVFLVAAVVRSVTYAATGRMTTTAVLGAVLALVVLPLGAWIGGWLHARLSERAFDALVAALLVGTGLRLLW